MVQEFTGAPQGIAVKVGYPAVQIPKELRTQSDCCNERYSLVDLEHLMKVKLYLKRHGGWTLMAVKQNGNCLFSTVLAGLDIPEEYTTRLFRNELVLFCSKNARVLHKQHSQSLRDQFAGEKSQEGKVLKDFSICSYLHFLLKSGSWGDFVYIDMISRMWGLKITVLDATYKHELWERRVRRNLPLEQADVVVLFSHNHYSAVMKRKRIEAKKPPRIIRVPVKGLTGLPGLQMDFTSYEDDDDDDGSDAESSDPFWKSWTTHEEPRQEQEYVTIQKELHEPLVRFFKSHWGLIFPDTLDIVCSFCDQEFNFSRNLRQHCRKEHKDSLSGITHFSALQENAAQQNLQQRSIVQHELVSLQQGSIVQQGFVSLSKQFFCENCDKVFHTKDTLKRHKKEKHATHSLVDLQCIFCHKGPFGNPRCRKWHQRSCSENPNKQAFSCVHCNKEYQTKLNLESHVNNMHS